MNQHIIKLVRQALNECVSTPVESVIASRIDDHGIVEIPNTFAEKFAELIVEECVIRAEREWIRNGSDTEHNQAVSQVIESIKQHFGVEE